jgi:oligoendopeptidase F
LSRLVPSLAALAALAFSATPLAGSAQEGPATDRKLVADRYKWKLGELYPSDEAWAAAKAAYPKKVQGFARFKGHLGDSPRALGDALTEMGALRNELERLSVYAESRSNEDTRADGPRAMKTEADSLAVALGTATSWIRPELLAVPAAKVKAALAKEPRLRPWSMYLDDVLRWKRHTLPAAEERIVAMSGELSNAGGTISGVLRDADLPYPSLKLSSGKEVRLDPAGYQGARTSPVREDRIKVFQAFFGAFKTYEGTFGSTLQAAAKAHAFDREVHRFGSSLEAALFQNNIPVSVYRQLVLDVNQNLPTLHRYLKLRQKILGLPDLRYEDLYTPLVAENDRRYTVDQAMAMTLAAVAPLGEAYQEKLTHGFDAGWTDFLPSTGKHGGAYSTGVYGVHPYQLLNYNGQWEDVSTLAHESGHSMHTLLAYEHQPYATSDYAIFVAEVASTLNENLLFRKALAEAKDDPERLSLLGEHLELLRTTLFRQTMFAEFELQLHELADRGEAITGAKLSALYLELVRKYYGHAQGTCQVDDLYGVEWAFIPHFYYDFYVYQYATSVVASTAIAKEIREDEATGGTAARDRYLHMLASGSSRYPVDLLKGAGVDMTTSAPFKAAIEDMNTTMDQMDALVSKRAAN